MGLLKFFTAKGPPWYCENGEHLKVGTAFGKLMCFDCNTEVVLVRGYWDGNWYVEDNEHGYRAAKEEVKA